MRFFKLIFSLSMLLFCFQSYQQYIANRMLSFAIRYCFMVLQGIFLGTYIIFLVVYCFAWLLFMLSKARRRKIHKQNL